MSRQNVDVNGSSNAAGCRRLCKADYVHGHLTQANEVPPTGSPATGSATVVLDPAANTLSVHVTFSGLTSNTVAAHIHCCLDSLFEAGVNVGVATTVPAFPGFPLGVTSGTYDHVLDLTSASSYNPAFVTMEGGSVAQAEAALVNGIQNGETYLNIHTTNFPGGEIRGFLVASATPAQLSLLKTIPINGTAGNNPVGPVFGVIGSVVNDLTQLVPTLPPVPAVTSGANKHGAGTVHSVAASAANNHVYVPLPANTSYPDCAQGCIAVFGVP